MIGKIIGNRFVRKVILKNIRLSKNKKFLVWTFENDSITYIGFTPAIIYYGGKAHLWYSILVGYFLPPSYNIDFNAIIGKECYITFNSKKIVTNVIPIVNKNIGESTKKNQTKKQFLGGYQPQISEPYEEDSSQCETPQGNINETELFE